MLNIGQAIMCWVTLAECIIVLGIHSVQLKSRDHFSISLLAQFIRFMPASV